MAKARNTGEGEFLKASLTALIQKLLKTYSGYSTDKVKLALSQLLMSTFHDDFMFNLFSISLVRREELQNKGQQLVAFG